MRTYLLRGRRYSAFSGKLLLVGVFFVSFFGAIGYFSLDKPVAAVGASTLTAPFDGAVVSGTQYTMAWTKVAGAKEYQYESYSDANGLQKRWFTTYGGSTTSKVSFNIPEQTYWWRIRAIDTNGVAGGWSQLWKLTVDNTAPTTTLTTSSPSGAPNLYNGPITITGTVGVAEKNLASHTFTVTNPQGVVSIIGPISTANLTHSFTLDTSAGDGQYTITYSALDKAGNKSAAIASRVVVVDKTAPGAPVLSGDAARITQPDDAVHSWAPSTATDVKNYIFKAFGSEADAAAPDTAAAIATETLAANQTSITRATGTTDSTYWYRVAAVDNAGNKTWGDQVFSVTIDNTPPVTPTIAIKGFANGGITKARNHTVEWGSAIADAATYTFEYSSTTNPTVRGLEDTTDRSWQGDLADGDGTYSMRVMAFDTVGNPSGWSETVTIRIDGKVPKVILNEIASTTAPATATLTGTVDDSTITEVTIMLNGVALGTRPVTNGTFSYPFVSLAAADYAIAVRATDEAKNVGEASIDFVVTNPVVPAAPVANPTGNDSPAPAGRTAVATPIAGPAPADDAEGEVFEPVAAQDRSAIESEATEAGQETKGVTDSRVVGDSSLMMWLGWIVALVLAMGWFWWMVAGRRRRREDE